MSVLANVLSFLIKPFNVAIFPLVLYRIIKNFSLQKILKAIAVSLLAFFVITIPFFPKDPLLGAFNHFFGSLDVYPYTSINAYNFWGLFGWWRSDATLVLNLSNHIWGLILYALVLCIIFVPYFAKKGRIEAPFDYFACALSSLGFFLFVTRMHERHLFPAFALLIVSACIFRSRVLIFSYIVLAVINFINLFYSYYYYNVAFNNPLASKNILFDISSNYRLFFSISSLVIFVVMLVTYFLKARISSRKL